MSLPKSGVGGDLFSKVDPDNFEDADLKDERTTELCQPSIASNDDAVESTITFSPPLYKQRYDVVHDILHQAEVTSVGISALMFE